MMCIDDIRPRPALPQPSNLLPTPSHHPIITTPGNNCLYVCISLHELARVCMSLVLRGYRRNFCCHRDWASKVLELFIYSDWSPLAGWLSTSISHEGYMRSPGTKSVLTQMPGWRLERSRNDSMRCNNLGTSHHAIGNGLKY